MTSLQLEDYKMTYSPKILAALNAVMAAVGYVQKQGENNFHKYKFAGEAHLLEVLRPEMVKNGLILIPSQRRVAQIDDHGNTLVEIDYTLAHKDGDVWPEKLTAYGQGNDRNKNGGVGDKGLYKAITGANKYLLFKLFQIETGDDPENASEGDKSGPVEKPQKSPPGVTVVSEALKKVWDDCKVCDDGDSLMPILNERTVKILAVQVCRDFHDRLWVGPENSGFSGELKKLADSIKCAEAHEWIKRVEEAAKKEEKK